MSNLSFHNTPQEMYDALVEQFGEHKSSDPETDTRWVNIGAGAVSLIFFAPKSIYTDSRVRVKVAS